MFSPFEYSCPHRFLVADTGPPLAGMVARYSAARREKRLARAVNHQANVSIGDLCERLPALFVQARKGGAAGANAWSAERRVRSLP